MLSSDDLHHLTDSLNRNVGVATVKHELSNHTWGHIMEPTLYMSQSILDCMLVKSDTTSFIESRQIQHTRLGTHVIEPSGQASQAWFAAELVIVFQMRN